MMKFSKLVLACSLVFAATAAMATPPKTTPEPEVTVNAALAGAAGVIGDVKGGNSTSTATGGAVLGSGNSAQGQDQKQQQTAVSGSISGSNSGGNKLTNEGNNAAQKTKVDVVVQGDNVESNTPPVMPGVLPSVPTSCRLYLFGGGSTRDGAGSGTFPIGNDQTCLSGAKLNFMERVGGFTQAEKQAVVCKVEGMAELETCKKLADKQKTAAVIQPSIQPVQYVTADGQPSTYTGTDELVIQRHGLKPVNTFAAK